MFISFPPTSTQGEAEKQATSRAVHTYIQGVCLTNASQKNDQTLVMWASKAQWAAKSSIYLESLGPAAEIDSKVKLILRLRKHITPSSVPDPEFSTVAY